MKMRITPYVFLLIAYTLSLAHSVIPHHHHKSAEEAHIAHHHADGSNHDHKHHHDNDHDESAGHEGHLFLLNHDINGDVLSLASKQEKVTKTPKTKISSLSVAPGFRSTFKAHLVFHPPLDDRLLPLYPFPSRALRAPPIA